MTYSQSKDVLVIKKNVEDIGELFCVWFPGTTNKE